MNDCENIRLTPKGVFYAVLKFDLNLDIELEDTSIDPCWNEISTKMEKGGYFQFHEQVDAEEDDSLDMFIDCWCEPLKRYYELSDEQLALSFKKFVNWFLPDDKQII